MLQRHCRDIHGQNLTQTTTCVDENRGLYMVRQSSKGGVMYPIHVKKMMGGNETGVQCENSECMDFMRVAWRSGITTAECRHVVEVGKNPHFPESTNLSSATLEDLSADGKYRMFSDEKLSACKELQKNARESNSQCIVPMYDGTRFIHFSVYDGNVNYYSKFGRVVVSVDLLNGILDCRCCRRKVSCVHKRICLWFLGEKGLLETFRSTSSPVDSQTTTANPMETEKMAEPTIIYPPCDCTILEKMCAYLRKEKRIPLNHDISNPIPPKKLIPKETVCYYCNKALSRPIKITNKASILTMARMFEGVEMYIKTCDNCSMCYRYQEHDDGLHNFNDSFVIGIDVCLFLRNCLQQHLPIGSMVNVMENQLNVSLNSQTVLNAYLHFDALSDHSYNYYCSLCGHHPSTLIMDLNKKIAFDCPASDLELPEEYDMAEADIVDGDDFWRKVEMEMIIRGFPGRKIAGFAMKPNLLFWAPFVGEKTRKSSLMINTEHRKVGRHDGELEKDCREITEERLLEMLNNSTLKEVQSFSNSLGCKGKGSKLDQIMQIKNAISKNNENFKKAFNKLWGCSGGWVSGTCPHGVIYALKFVLRAESPRDYIDIILSMAHQPNVVVSDMANMLVAHGNKRSPNMFRPFDGMVAEPTQENVQLAKEGELCVSFPWLQGETASTSEIPYYEDVHPVTSSGYHLCLFDRLHERNVKKEEEILRRVGNVKELRGHLNTQKDEQLHSSYNHDSRFLNNMKPVNHIFLFRSNIDIRNEKINARLKQDLENAFRHAVVEDEQGRAVVDKSSKIPTVKNGKKQNFKRNCSFEPAELPNKAAKVDSADINYEKESSRSPPESISENENPESMKPAMSTNNRDMDSYWIPELGLKYRDKAIIKDGLWLNDRVIVAAMRLLRVMAPNIGGLQDVIVAKKHGFSNSPQDDKIIQILNVRDCHWITMSNIHCFPFEMSIYDSLLDLNKKKDKISYPKSIDESACQLVKPAMGLHVLVEEVQQQKGGSDCGLFAIAFATLLTLGQDPSSATFNQEVMRDELIKAFTNKDMAGFSSAVATLDQKNSRVLYKWNCRVFCHCRMPDDGNLMVQCGKCKEWYHQECEKGGDFQDPQWECTTCISKKRRKNRRTNKLLIDLQEGSTRYPEQSKRAQELYRCIVDAHPHERLHPEAEKHIGCMTLEHYYTVSKEKRGRRCMLGCTYTESIPRFDYFVIIFTDENETDDCFFSTILHELAHVLDSSGKIHAKEFKKHCKDIVESVKKAQHKFPEPFCNTKIDVDEVIH